jgi:hypothetical protein
LFQTDHVWCRFPTATVKNSATVTDASAPSVAGFSPRGPNTITHGLMKPDVSAPGADILAAWTGLSSVSGTNDVDDRRVSTIFVGFRIKTLNKEVRFDVV